MYQLAKLQIQHEVLTRFTVSPTYDKGFFTYFIIFSCMSNYISKLFKSQCNVKTILMLNIRKIDKYKEGFL